jgi:hypothetical protein
MDRAASNLCWAVATNLVGVLTTRIADAAVTRWLSLAIALAGLSGAACSGRERVNRDCQWNHDTVFEIDVTDRTHQTHLRYDADLMEELAIRYADAHGGLVARFGFAETRDTCMTKLFAVIGNYHSVSEGQIRQWIGRRNLTFDLAVFVSFLAWWFVAGRALIRRLFNSWSFRGAVAVFAAVTLTPIVSAVGGAAGTAWAIVWEIVRVGNAHMSHRAARVPWPYYVPSLFLAALVICAFVAWREYRIAKQRAELMDLEDASSRHRILVR